MLAAMAALLVPLAWQTPFSLARDRAEGPVIGVALLAGLAVAGRRWNRPRLAAATTAFLQLTLFTILGVVLSYTLAARGAPLWDGQLAAWDGALGVDWPAIRAVVDRSSTLIWGLWLAYHGLIPQMILVVVALSYLARLEVLRVTVTAAILSGFVTVLLSGLMPAAGNLFDPGGYERLWPPVALQQAALIAGLRDGSWRVLDLGAMQGIITFPSYHATLAAIFVHAFRAIPRLAVPGALWAGLTIIATPICGGHYAVDVITGLALALVSIPLAKRLAGIQRLRSAGSRLSPDRHASQATLSTTGGTT